MKSWRLSAIALMAWGVFASIQSSLGEIPRHVAPPIEMRIPVPYQLIAAFGDRYLAANIAIWRAVVVGVTELDAGAQAAVAAAHLDASWLSPGHEDGYWVSNATLPWDGYYAENQTVLARAGQARRGDMWPAFYEGVNYTLFAGDFEAAAKAYEKAAGNVDDEPTRTALLELAQQWRVRAGDESLALRMLDVNSKRFRGAGMQRQIAVARQRITGLQELRKAAKSFVSMHGRAPADLSELIGPGLLSALPKDPSRRGYALRDGVVVLN